MDDIDNNVDNALAVEPPKNTGADRESLRLALISVAVAAAALGVAVLVYNSSRIPFRTPGIISVGPRPEPEEGQTSEEAQDAESAGCTITGGDCTR